MLDLYQVLIYLLKKISSKHSSTNCCPLLKHKNLSKGAKRNLWLEVLQELKATVFLKLYYPEFCSSNVEKA